MYKILFLICLLFISTASVFAQDLKILSVSKSKLKADMRPQQYFKQNKISRDTLIFNLNKNLSDHFKNKNLNIDFIGLSKEQQNELSAAKLYSKKVIVNPNERKAPSKYSFLRFFRTKNLKNNVCYLKPNAIIANNPSNIGSKGLIVFSKYRINNKWAVNFDFRNKTTLTLHYSIYDNQGTLIKHYRAKMDINFQKDMNKEVLFHVQNKLAQLCAEQISADLK